VHRQQQDILKKFLQVERRVKRHFRYCPTLSLQRVGTGVKHGSLIEATKVPAPARCNPSYSAVWETEIEKIVV
jgi:hypothetical protein